MRLIQHQLPASTRYGRGSIQLASAGAGGSDRAWTMKQEVKTPNYTTCWKDLPRARAEPQSTKGSFSFRSKYEAATPC
jgi:Domain of unknown function (DUF4113)